MCKLQGVWWGVSVCTDRNITQSVECPYDPRLDVAWHRCNRPLPFRATLGLRCRPIWVSQTTAERLETCANCQIAHTSFHRKEIEYAPAGDFFCHNMWTSAFSKGSETHQVRIPENKSRKERLAVFLILNFTTSPSCTYTQLQLRGATICLKRKLSPALSR